MAAGPEIAVIIGGICIGDAICTLARWFEVFEIRIFMPFSDEISMESTDDPSIMSTSFLTKRRSIMPRSLPESSCNPQSLAF